MKKILKIPTAEFLKLKWSQIETVRHELKWSAWIGDAIRNVTSWLGVKFIRTGRKLLAWSGGRCSWCGRNPGFSFVISGEGIRCYGLSRDCTEEE